MKRTALSFIAGALLASTVAVVTVWLTDPPAFSKCAERIPTRIVVVGDHVTTIHKQVQ
jgi:hypothetical protein